MSYLLYLCLFAYSGVQQLLCYDFVLFFFILYDLCCHFLWIVLFWIAPSVFSNVYFLYKHFNHVSLNYKEMYDYDL